jgi:uncharacterized membrane protein
MWLIAIDGGAFVILSRTIIGTGLWISLRGQWGVTVISGVFGVVSFCVFLWALGQAPVGVVTALREVSVLFASMIGVIFLKERFSVLRLAGAILISVGVGSLALL